MGVIIWICNCNVVVQTCLLSKKWKDFWCSVPCLNFELRSHQSNTLRLSNFVESVLIHRDGSNLQSFRLRTSWDWPKDEDEDLDSESVDIRRMSSWIIFALRHNVEVLDVQFDNEQPPPAIRQRVFMSTSLKELRLDSCEESECFFILEVPDLVCLPSLTILFLKDLTIENADKLSQMLSSCPSLHTLSMLDCFWDDEDILTISTPKLKTFRFKSVNCDGLHVKSAPCLVSLHIKSWSLTWLIDDCPSLFDANIAIHTSSPESMERLVRALSKVESLTISPNITSYKEYGLHLHKWSQTPINSLKFLELNILFSKNHVQVVTLLRSCPNIETLVLKNIVSEDREDESEEKVELKEELSHLKLVKFYNFRGSKNEVQLIELFFNKATNMEKLIVMAPEHIDDSERKKLLAKIPKILLKNPRATRICTDASSASVSCVLV